MNILEPIRARLGGITQGDYDSVRSANRKLALVLRSPGTADEAIVAKCSDDDEAHFFANAPADIARLIAAVEAVLVEHSEDVFRGHLSNGCRICGGGMGWPCPTVGAIRTALKGDAA